MCDSSAIWRRFCDAANAAREEEKRANEQALKANMEAADFNECFRYPYIDICIIMRDLDLNLYYFVEGKVQTSIAHLIRVWAAPEIGPAGGTPTP